MNFRVENLSTISEVCGKEVPLSAYSVPAASKLCGIVDGEIKAREKSAVVGIEVIRSH